MRPFLRAVFLDNIAFKLLSIIFAFATWAWVQGERVVEQKVRVPVEWVYPDHLALVGDVPRTLALTVSGSQVFVRNVRRAELGMQVDLTDASPGPQRVEFQDRTINNLPGNVRVLALSPSAVDFELDMKTRKKVPVRVVTGGEPSAGYRLLTVEVEPGTVELEGPYRTLSSVEDVATAMVDIKGIRKPRRETVSLGDLPNHVSAVGDGDIHVSIDVEPISSTLAMTGVAVLSRDRTWIPLPEQVEVELEGPVADLDTISREDITVMVHVDDGVERGVHRAVAHGGPVRYQVIHPYSDRVTVKRIRPAVIEIQPQP